jgi:hypothetical protein
MNKLMYEDVSKISGLATWSENCKWYSSLPLGAAVSLFVSQSSEFCRRNPLCCFSTSVVYFVMDSVRELLDTPSQAYYNSNSNWVEQFIFRRRDVMLYHKPSFMIYTLSGENKWNSSFLQRNRFLTCSRQPYWVPYAALFTECSILCWHVSTPFLWYWCCDFIFNTIFLAISL